MRRILIPFAALVALGLMGCQGKTEYKVDKNDPSSVENASKVEPVPMRSDGTPLSEVNGQAEPPKKN